MSSFHVMSNSDTRQRRFYIYQYMYSYVYNYRRNTEGREEDLPSFVLSD